MSSADENREMFKILQNINNCFHETYTLKGIVSRDFRDLQFFKINGVSNIAAECPIF